MSQKPGFFQVVSEWFDRNFANPEVLSLLLTLVLIIVVLEALGYILAPILVSIVLAYLLGGFVNWLERVGCVHGLAVFIAYLVFLALLVVALLTLIPALWKQLGNFVTSFPDVVAHASGFLNNLKDQYPNLLSAFNVSEVVDAFKTHMAEMGKTAVSYSVAGLGNAITFILYFILVPILSFIFFKDSRQITKWSSRFLPKNRSLLQKVWTKVNKQIGNYIRGRIIEIILVGMVSIIAFSLLDLQYALLLGALVGLSVIVPYIGAVLITIPIVILALFQWGLAAHFFYAMIVYAIIIIVDANILVPWLFSEAMDLHPVVIILSVLIFGGLWGFWGVFFAIPLATVADVVLRSWPHEVPMN